MSQIPVLMRGLIGLLAAMLAGSATMTLLFMIGALMMGGDSTDVATAGTALIMVFLICLMAWGVGGVVLGAPAWLILHGLKLRNRIACALAGAATAGFGALLVGRQLLGMALINTAQDRADALSSQASLIGVGALSGVVAGLVLWMVVYGPDRPARTTD